MAAQCWQVDAARALEVALESGEEPMLAAAAPPRRSTGRRAVILAARALLAAGAGAALLAACAGHRGLRRVGAEGLEEKFGVVDVVSTLQQGLSASAKAITDAKTISSDIAALGAPALKEQALVQRLKGTSKHVNLTEMSNLSPQDLLKPASQDRHDGNVCPTDEEVHQGLCYRKCSVLTNLTYPIRTTAFACCKEQPCSFFNTKFTNPLVVCSGFDVAGTAQGGGCPHAPGDCMANEEFSLGVCYKRCAILTENKYPYRSAAASCCRYNDHFACLDALNVITSVSFNVGGGVGDGHNSTPEEPHWPIPNITEAPSN